MNKPRTTPAISARKLPRQDRSTQLVSDILEAAVRVLTREGATRFTTARVAEEAGVSVGSLYQYFPNKQAILFRLQTDEWRRTSDALNAILTDAGIAPLERLRSAVRAFFESEWEEASFRTALEDAAPFYRDAPGVTEHRTMVRRQAVAFMAEALPAATPKQHAFAADVVMTTMAALGKAISERARSKAEVQAWAAAAGEMLCGYVANQSTSAKTKPSRSRTSPPRTSIADENTGASKTNV